MGSQQHGFTHARIMGSPYWPIDMTGPSGWVEHPDVYFAAFDALLADARARGIRLMPSLLLTYKLHVLTDLPMEDMDQTQQDREQEADDLLEAQEGKGYGEDEGEREDALPE